MSDNKSKMEEKPIGRLPQHIKFWYSSTKFEKYPEMAAEGVGKAFLYLAWLIFMFAIILAIGLTIRFHGIAKEEIKALDKEFSEINYKDGILQVSTENQEFSSNFGNLIINTDEITDEQIKKYEDSTSNKPQFIWLRDKVIVKFENNKLNYYYKDILDNFGLKEFNKIDLINLLSSKLDSPQIYIFFMIAMILYAFIAYFISTLIEILVLSVFGALTSLIAGIKIRYRAVFNMTVYSFTISTVLQLIYNYIQLFTDFNIKYFDVMYTTIAFICLAAAIFMIKSDVIKQQIELMRIIEIKKKEQQEEKKEEPDREERKEKEEKEKKEENDRKENDKDEKKEENNSLNDEAQGET